MTWFTRVRCNEGEKELELKNRGEKSEKVSNDGGPEDAESGKGRLMVVLCKYLKVVFGRSTLSCDNPERNRKEPL